jgi:hypothetical protein
MGAEELTGNYTYRSYRDVPEPVQSFNDLRFAQLALQLAVRPDGTATGTLIFPAPAGVEPPTMDISGRVSAGAPVQVRLTGKGHPGTSTADFHYEYDGVVLRHWETGIDQRLVLGGTVLRAKDHGSGATLARAGFTASFLAVRRET